MRYPQLLMMLVLAGVFSCDRPAPTAPPATRTTKITSFGGFGFELPVPKGWEESDTVHTRPEQVVEWTHTAAGEEGTVQVAAGAGGESDLQKAAAMVAKRTDGTIDPASLKIDGEPAVRITNPNAHDPKSTAQVIICNHDQLHYEIVVLPDRAGKVPSVDELLQGWKWVPRESFIHHLEMRQAPAVALAGWITLAYPRSMYVTTDTGMSYAIECPHPFTSESEFSFQFSLLPTEDSPMTSIGAVARRLQTIVPSDEPIRWETCPSGRKISQVLTRTWPATAPVPKTYEVIAVVSASNSEAIWVAFRIGSSATSDQAACLEAARHIVDSVKLTLEQ